MLPLRKLKLAMSEYCVGGEDDYSFPEAVVLPRSPVVSNSSMDRDERETTTLGLDFAGESISTATNNKKEKNNRFFNAQKFYASVKKTCFNDEVDEDREKSTTTRDYFLLAMRDVFLSNIPYPATDEFSVKSKFTLPCNTLGLTFFLFDRTLCDWYSLVFYLVGRIRFVF